MDPVLAGLPIRTSHQWLSSVEGVCNVRYWITLKKQHLEDTNIQKN